MTCRNYGNTLDRHGRNTLSSERVRELAQHLAVCADCRGEKRERDVIRLALEVGGHGPVRIPAGAADELLVRVARQREADRFVAANPLAQVAVVGRRWVPRLAVAALLFASVSAAILAGVGSGVSTAGQAVASLVVVPDEPLVDDVLFDAVLSMGGAR